METGIHTSTDGELECGGKSKRAVRASGFPAPPTYLRGQACGNGGEEEMPLADFLFINGFGKIIYRHSGLGEFMRK